MRACGYSTIRPWPFMKYWSEVRTLEPASRMARFGVGRLTTVVRTCMAQSSQVAAPAVTIMQSL
jgi:hypothetical protein